MSSKKDDAKSNLSSNKNYQLNSTDFNNDNNENEANELPSSGIVEKLRRIHLGAAAAASDLSLYRHQDKLSTDMGDNNNHNNFNHLRNGGASYNENGNLTNYDNINSSTTTSHRTQSATFSPSKTSSYVNETTPPDEYAWVPAGEHILVERYMHSLPITERPIIDTQGAQTRRQRLAYQVKLENFLT